MHQGCQHCVSQKSELFAKCLKYALPQVIGLPRHRRSQLGGSAFDVFVWNHKFFLQNSWILGVLAGGFVMECAKKSWF